MAKFLLLILTGMLPARVLMLIVLEPALLGTAPRACVSGRRWVRGDVTVMWLVGRGTDPLSCWCGLSCCSPSFCFRGTLELTFLQPVVGFPSVLS